jgi:hypothetical protein
MNHLFPQTQMDGNATKHKKISRSARSQAKLIKIFFVQYVGKNWFYFLINTCDMCAYGKIINLNYIKEAYKLLKIFFFDQGEFDRFF